MLFELLFPLRDVWFPFNVVQYLTFRSAAAAAFAVVLSLTLGPATIRWLQRLSVGQSIREEGPDSHQEKAGTPTMGGVLIVISVVVPTVLWASPSNTYVWVALAGTIGFGAIGFLDDFLKVKRQHNLGLSARTKLALQIGVALLVGLFLYRLPAATVDLHFPFFKDLVFPLGLAYLPWTAVVLAGTSNAVNLTDGLDGLAIGATLIAAATYAIFTYVAGNTITATYLNIAYVPGAGELAIFCASMVGASLGFLWYNAHPAQMFMGDVGSLALGGGIGTVALVSKQEILLIVAGGLFVLEALSVVVQVASFKLRGRRVLRMAPLHHHFELAGWSETKIVVRFWILSLMFAFLALSTLKLR